MSSVFNTPSNKRVADRLDRGHFDIQKPYESFPDLSMWLIPAGC
jgi:hypothetical protein